MAATGSLAKALICPKCGKTFSIGEVHQLCECGSPLLVQYDLEKAKETITRGSFHGRGANLWRYRELLPVQDDRNIVSLGEGYTPLLPLERAGKISGIPNLFLKDEGIIPTGTFKARGAAVGVSRAKELGVRQLAMPTNGNAGAAWSVYGARAGIEVTIVMPEDAPKITRNECAAAGAKLYLVKGLISDCGKIVGAGVKAHGWFDASTLKEPYRIEGKKTMGLEIAEQFGWELPDVILYPTGGGVGIIGIWKALKELREIGIVQGPLPRLVAVQAEGCAPIVKAYEEGRRNPSSLKTRRRWLSASMYPRPWVISWCWKPSRKPAAARRQYRMSRSCPPWANWPGRKGPLSARKGRPSMRRQNSCGKRAGSVKATGWCC